MPLFHEFLQLWAHWYNLGITFAPGQVEERIQFGAHWRQYLIRVGLEGTGPERILLFYHGGGWQFGRPELFRKYAWLLAQEGYQVFMPSHRKIPLHNYQQIQVDIQLALKTAVDWTRARGVEKPEIVLGGMSAGGNLAALLALDPENRKAAGVDLEQITGLFLLAAPLNFDKMWSSPSLLGFAGPRGGELYRKANPIYFLEDNLPPPTLIVHGEYDAMVELESARSFYEKIERSWPDRAQWLMLPKASHVDVAKWVYQDNGVRRAILGWLGGI